MAGRIARLGLKARRAARCRGMSTKISHPLPPRLHSLAAMAGLLERLERTPSSASAEQYRGVARQVSALLARAEPDAHLSALLDAAPESAQLYENMRYEIAGLCRAPLESALNAELAATAAIARARARA
jgi:predicted NAD/FAD-binding protein